MMDETVRRSWELQPHQFVITNPNWDQALEDACNELKDWFGMKVMGSFFWIPACSYTLGMHC